MVKLRCFVAMAFDHDDTDAVYAVILRVLRRMKTTGTPIAITAVRVDRVEHNDNIDTRIIAELNAADLVIADLTYARPSVYYEAGYAQRAVPVVYTCRRDHFRAREGDQHGNLRVHFDLQMKNIVAWRDAKDRSFPERLARRLHYVIRPLVSEKEKATARANAERAFAQLSTTAKHTRLLEEAERFARQRGIRTFTDLRTVARRLEGGVPPIERRWKWPSALLQTRLSRAVEGGAAFSGVRNVPGGAEAWVFFVAHSWSRGRLRAATELAVRAPAYDVASLAKSGDAVTVTEHVVFCARQQVPRSAVAEVLPHFSAVDPRTLRNDTETTIPLVTAAGAISLATAEGLVLIHDHGIRSYAPLRSGSASYYELKVGGVPQFIIRVRGLRPYDPSRDPEHTTAAVPSRSPTTADITGRRLDRRIHVHVLDGIASVEEWIEKLSTLTPARR